MEQNSGQTAQAPQTVKLSPTAKVPNDEFRADRRSEV
jgi:hypothetical protein